MKKFVAIVSSVLLVVALAATVYIGIFLQRGRWENENSQAIFRPGIDFSVRMNEVACLVNGVDPYDVWHKDVVKPPFYPLHDPYLRSKIQYAPINAYTPWEYPVMMPLLLLPRQIAWIVYYGSMFLCILALAWYAFCRGRALGGGWTGLILATFPLLVLTHPIFVNLCVGNWTLHIIAAFVGMVYCLNRGKDKLAGVCWAFAMIKPQLALLCAVPLLLRRKWMVCFVAVGVCVLATIPAMLLCGKSMLSLIVEAPAAGTNEFYGCGVMPYALFKMLPLNLASLACLLIGLAICMLLIRCVRVCDDWLYLMMPVAVCAVSWTYAQQYSYVFGWFLLMVAIMALLQNPRSRFLWVFCPLLVLSASRIYRCLYGVANIYQLKCLALFRHSEELYRNLDSCNSLLTLSLLIVFCFWLVKKGGRRLEGATN